MANTSVFILAPDFPKLEDCEMIAGPYAESLPAAKRMGYDGVEIVMGDAVKFDAGAFKALLQQHGMKVSAINSGGTASSSVAYSR
jgi:sugar phosphate isomerase/epimerase